MKSIVLPYPGDYSRLVDYMRDIKPVRKYWDVLNGAWMSPANLWRWHWENIESKMPIAISSQKTR